MNSKQEESFDGKPYHYYGKKLVETPNGTTVLRKVAITGIEEDGVMTIGIALCSEKDMFNRKKGRTISQGRAIKAMNEPEIINEKDTMDLFMITTDKPGKEFVSYCNEYCIVDDAEFEEL